jgi:hypothetical protein
MSMFSQSLIQGLINPSYADALGTAGMLAGSMPDRLRLEREERAKEEAEKMQAMQQQSALMSAYYMAQQPGGSNPSAAMVQGVPGLKAQDLFAAATAGRAAASDAAKGTAAQKRQQGIETVTQIASRSDVSNPNVQRAIQQVALNYGLTKDDLAMVLPTATKGSTQVIKRDVNGVPTNILVDKTTGADIANLGAAPATQEGADTATFASVGNFRDEKGNIYSVTEQRNKQGGIEPIYTAVTPGAPKTPSGNLVQLGGTYGVAANELAGMAGDRTAAQEFSKMQVAAAIQLPELQGSLANINATFDLLQTVPTGGPVNIANTAVESFLGTTSADKAELQVLLGNEMYKRLKPLFGGVISEGERQVIEGLYGSLRKGNEANEGILRALKRETESAVQRANMLRKAGSMDEYNTLLDKMNPETTSEGVNEVSWSDL